MSLKDLLKKLENGFLVSNIQKSYIKTGYLDEEKLLGLSGVPVGSIIELFGEASTGKSTICLNLMANIVKSRYFPVYIDAYYSSGYKDTINKDFIEISSNNSKKIIEALDKLPSESVIIIDSLAALDDTELFVKQLDNIKQLLTKRGSILIYTNEMRDIFYTNNKKSFGSKSLRACTDIRIKTSKKERHFTLLTVKNKYSTILGEQVL